MATTIIDLYAEFDTACGAAHSPRTAEELRELLHAAELRYEQVGPAFWSLVFDTGWAEGRDISDADWAARMDAITAELATDPTA